MRWIAILVLLAACGRSWLRDEDGSTVGEALRSAQKTEPVLVTGDRVYLMRKGALRAEIDAFANALVEAVAKNEPTSPGSLPGTGDVIAMAYPGRRLEFGTPQGFVVVQRAAGELGTRYWATVWKSNQKQLFVTSRGAATLDGAWSRLEQAAIARGGEPWGPSQVGIWPEPTPVRFERSVGVDYRGMDKGDG
jgi:hypothetical protein